MNKLSINLFLSYSTALLSFFIILLLARLLGAENFSWVALGLAVGVFVTPLINLGSDRTFVRDAVGAAGTVDNMAASNFGQRLFVCLGVSIVLVIASNFYTSNLADAISMVSLSLWAGLLGLYPTSWFDYSHDTRRQNVFGLSERVCNLILIGMLYLYTQDVSETFLIGLLLLTIRIFFICLQMKSWWARHANINFQIKLSPPRQNGDGINFHITIAGVANSCVTHGSQLILAANNEPAELSSYSLAFQLMTIIFLFQGQVIRLSSRTIAEACRSKNEAFRSIIYNASFLFAGSALLAIGAWTAIEFLPHFLADPRFEVMSQYSPILCIWVVIAGVGMSITQHSIALNQESFYLGMAIIGGVFSLLLGLVFVPDYGAYAGVLILLTINGLMILANLLRLLYVINARKERDLGSYTAVS